MKAGELESGDLVQVADNTAPYVVVDVVSSGLVRVRPFHRKGLLVHPSRLTRFPAPRDHGRKP